VRKKKPKLCRTHQMKCPTENCGWVHLKTEPCPKCATRGEYERNRQGKNTNGIQAKMTKKDKRKRKKKG